MIKLENTEVYGWEAAIRGMRNPMNSWDKSDSFQCDGQGCYFEDCPQWENDICNGGIGNFVVGVNDLKLMKSLAKAGNDHGKFLRMITVTVDITAPLYWWKEFDTYKVGTVANSCSTMHKIHAKEFTLDDFSHEHLIRPTTRYDIDCSIAHSYEQPYYPYDVLEQIIWLLNVCRNYYLQTKDKELWWQMIQLLPSSYNQKRTVQLNYQVLKQMYFSRRNHKLDEWHTFCEWMESLPYFKEICVDVQ